METITATNAKQLAINKTWENILNGIKKAVERGDKYTERDKISESHIKKLKCLGFMILHQQYHYNNAYSTFEKYFIYWDQNEYNKSALAEYHLRQFDLGLIHRIFNKKPDMNSIKL